MEIFDYGRMSSSLAKYGMQCSKVERLWHYSSRSDEAD